MRMAYPFNIFMTDLAVYGFRGFQLDHIAMEGRAAVAVTPRTVYLHYAAPPTEDEHS